MQATMKIAAWGIILELTLLGLLLAGPVQAATFTVTRTDDPTPGFCGSNGEHRGQWEYHGLGGHRGSNLAGQHLAL